MEISNLRLKKFLQDTSLLEAEIINNNFKEAEKTNKGLARLLIKKDLLSKEDIDKLYAYILGVPFVDLSDSEVSPEIWSILDLDFMIDNQVLPYNRRFNALEVAMVNPVDYLAIDKMREKSGYDILPRLISKKNFVALVNRLVSLYNKIEGDEVGLESIQNKDIEDLQNAAQKQIELVGLAEERSIENLVSTILRNGIQDEANEIHIEPDDKELYVRYRIDKKLTNPFILPGRLSPIMSAKFKMMADLDVSEVSQPQEGRFRFEDNSIRISTVPVFNGEKITLVPSKRKNSFILNNIDLRKKDIELIKSILYNDGGVILVAGKTNSGRTTTLYSLLGALDPLEKNIATIEDTIEKNVPRINQTQLDLAKGLDFKAALQAHIKQDPDAIMMDELKCADSIKLAFQAAMPGRMIIASISSDDSVEALKNIIQMGVKRFYIGAVLDLIISKKTVRRLCPECKMRKKLTEIELTELYRHLPAKKINQLLLNEGVLKNKSQKIKDIYFYKARGCKFCDKTGYKGLLGIYEIMQITEEIEEFLEEEDWYSEKNKILNHAKKKGMLTLFEDSLIKAANGYTSMAEILSGFDY